jgi:hypothetical protein
VKLGEPTGELTRCDGGDWISGPGCENMVRVLHDPYCTADLALCGECNGGGEIYGPIIVPSWEDEEEVEHAFTPECCADCRRLIEDEDRYAAECDEAHEEELGRLAQQRPPTLWSRVRCWVARFVR